MHSRCALSKFCQWDECLGRSWTMMPSGILSLVSYFEASHENALIIVLGEDSRPVIPPTRFSTPALQELLRACWQKDPFMRPNFSTVVQDLKQLRKSSGLPEEIVSPKFPEWQESEGFEFRVSRPSPDMHPIPLFPGTPRKSLYL